MPDPNQKIRFGNDVTRVVVFDTNVLEARYLAPLLRGERCRDFDLLRTNTPAYRPAIYIKSFYEICQHCKLGDKKKRPWLSDEFSYPGGLDTGRRILSKIPELSAELNLYWWFNMAEEWRDLDWDEEA